MKKIKFKSTTDLKVHVANLLAPINLVRTLTPTVPISSPEICIQWGTIPIITAAIIVTISIWESQSAKIGPAGAPVAIAELQKNAPRISTTPPKQPNK